MAATSFKAGYNAVFSNRLEHLTDETTVDEVRKLYDDWATKYDEDILEVARFKGFSPIVKTLDDAVQEELKDLTKENIKVMDAGAGTGLVGVELHKFGFTTIDALDISPGMLEEAKKKNVYRKFICAALGDQRILEIETGEYDVLICVGVFAIAHVPPVAIMELIRMVKAGGLVCCAVRNDELKEYYGKMMELEAAGHWKLVKERKVPYYERDDLPTECTAFVYKVLKH
ncbi:Methyltransferase domain [Porites harrisoni]